ncbi:GNAT family N-acetyltransferase [Aquimarina rhabdastrellae]
MESLLEAANIFLTEEEHSARIDKYFSDTYVLVIENQKIGMIKYIENDDEVELVQFQILPDYQLRGIGKKVLDYLKEVTLSKKKMLVLKVLKNNPARNLYERNGFEIIGEDDIEFLMKWKP